MFWHCNLCGKSNHWAASVIQRGREDFKVGVGHNHPGEVGLAETAKLTAAIKRKATDDFFRPASAIVDKVLFEDMETTTALLTLPKPETLARAADRCRQARGPPEPTDLEFVIDESSIPEHFLRADVETRGGRHVIFATEEQLAKLTEAKRWCVDGTFKLCRPPFSQLFSTNAFIRQGDHAK